tara:strand:- start:854 stop:1921 length:1068 start_codon:yes stop_codon:yes gene_type:complete
MNQSLISKLDQLVYRLSEITHLLNQENATKDLNSYRKLSQEHSEIEPLVLLYEQWNKNHDDLITAKDMLKDQETKDFAQQEIIESEKKANMIFFQIQKLLVPKDPNDEKNIFLEIRAGTGGDESALFVGDLLRMYLKYAENKNWKIEMISESLSEVGGYKEVIIRIIGSAYSRLKFESGGHRVQRIPETETQGRIHTSACTVAVLPEVDEIGEIDINSQDIRIDTFRASGAGGQHINKTDSAVRITHLPSGIVVECQDDRSQHKNKAQALKVLSARIKDIQTRELQAKEAATRKSLIGSGDRSERIRTYNFSQGRVTDHRINLTLYKLEAIMEGSLDELTDALMGEHQAELLSNL